MESIMQFLQDNHLLGLLIGISTFLIIGLFHPLVIKCEYYFGTKCWWWFLILGLIGVGLSIWVENVLWSTLLGVFSFSWIAVRLGVVKLPANTTWKAFASVCVICGIGFTVSMFIADLSYAGLGAEGAALLDQAKLGVLVGSVVSALLGCVLLNYTLPKSNK